MSQNTPLSFHVSDDQLARLQALGTGHGRRSEIIRLAILHHGNPEPGEYLSVSPEGPYVNKINVARGDWYGQHEEQAKALGVSVAALARFSLEKMLRQMEARQVIERHEDVLITD